MRNIEKFKHFLTEGVHEPKRKELFSKLEAAEYFGVEVDDVIYSDRIVSGKGVWINDETSECVYAKEKQVRISANTHPRSNR